MVEYSPELALGGVFIIAGSMLCLYWYLYWKRCFQGKLLTEGPYGYVRHPYYSGFILLTMGSAIGFPALETRLLAVITLSVLSVYIPKEEEQLLTRYGDEYRRYMEKVKWKLIPRIY